MGRTKDLFIKLREEEEFFKEHIIICKIKPTEAVTTAIDNKEQRANVIRQKIRIT